jgi:hypothetical protein
MVVRRCDARSLQIGFRNALLAQIVLRQVPVYALSAGTGIMTGVLEFP